ncbi:MAG: hypothetical protein ABEJ36_00830 [Candidatus Nanosalina sp.]
MNFDFDYSGLLVILGVILGVYFTFLSANPEMMELGSEEGNYGFYIMSIGNGECRFYPPEKGKPGNLSELKARKSFRCAGFWKSYYLHRRIELINSSVESREIVRLLEEARKNLRNGNLSAAAAKIDRIQIRRSYEIRKNLSRAH